MIKDYNELTPVENHNGIYYKRDDLFQPFSDIPVNGGKVRQCIALVKNNLDIIRKDCDNTIATASSIESPQGIIVGRVAKEFNLNSILAIGGGNQDDLPKLLEKHALVRASQSIGSEILAVNKLGYNSVLYSKLEKLRETRKFFMALFGINVDSNPDAILGTTMAQVNNLPLDKIKRIVVPVGSALMFSAILVQLHKLNWSGELIGVQIAGVDRKKTIDSIFSKFFFMERPKYTFILDKTYKYHNYVTEYIDENNTIQLDPIYEAKAYQYAKKNNLLQPGDLYWVVGNSKPVRDMFKNK